VILIEALCQLDGQLAKEPVECLLAGKGVVEADKMEFRLPVVHKLDETIRFRQVKYCRNVLLNLVACLKIQIC
jgi:hypothetical protein